MKVLGIIPARYASTRLPAKPLLDIAGKSMIQRVYEQVLKAESINKVVVATDHPDILSHVIEFGGDAYMTSTGHQSGTDRCFEALQKAGGVNAYDYVINIQGDEPFIQPEQINILAKCLDYRTEIATLAKKIEDIETLFNPHVPKMVLSRNHFALYFSRQTMPFIRDVPKENWLDHHDFYKHIGIYAYRTDILEQITRLPVSKLESLEKLEQLRWLEWGLHIKVAITELDTKGVDTQADLERIIRELKEK